MMDASALTIHAPAKVNLFLSVGAVRPDGYHDVTTVLQALAFGDTVTLAPADSLSVVCEPGIGLPAEANLAYRAARAMAERFERAPECAITIVKRIPAGGGLGGASADAAAVVLGLARWWGIDPYARAVVEVARSLGADVPFFLTGGAALFGERGDVLARRLRSLAGPVVVAKPREPVPTASAYAAFDALPAGEAACPDAIIEALEAGDVGSVARQLHNGLAAAAVHLVPEIGEALALLRAHPGVLGVAVAGSGSSVFGICSDEPAALLAAAAAREAGLWSVATSASPGGCTISGS